MVLWHPIIWQYAGHRTIHNNLSLITYHLFSLNIRVWSTLDFIYGCGLCPFYVFISSIQKVRILVFDYFFLGGGVIYFAAFKIRKLLFVCFFTNDENCVCVYFTIL